MDPTKVCAVREWLVACSVKQLQIFLGFANYYNYFIAHYSKIIAPLSKLL